jgi:hypothetical protein
MTLLQRDQHGDVGALRRSAPHEVVAAASRGKTGGSSVVERVIGPPTAARSGPADTGEEGLQFIGSHTRWRHRSGSSGPSSAPD